MKPNGVLCAFLLAVSAAALVAEVRAGGSAQRLRSALVRPNSRSEDDEDRRAVGRLSFQDNCLMCHSEELTSSQRLTSQQWAAEVTKMIGWGAPVPPEQKDPLVEYLASRYAANVPPPPVERIALEEALEGVRPERPHDTQHPGDSGRGAALFAANCSTCHGADARGADVGTNLVEKPVLLRPTQYHEIVRKGLRRMPGFAAALDPTQEADILSWLREQQIGRAS